MRKDRLLWMVMAVTMLAYAPVLTNEFVAWDDAQTIYANPRSNPPGLRDVLWYWTHPEHGEYLPLTRTVWALLAAPSRLQTADDLGGTLNPFLYHLASVLAHAISAGLVFLILRELPQHSWPAAAGALLFALHPVQVEAVAWASGLKDLLFALFALAAILGYIRSCRAERGRWKLYALASAAFLASIFSKPMGVVTPALAGAIAWILLDRPLRKVLLELAPWLAVSLLFGLLARHWMPAEGIPTAPAWMRPLIAGDSLAFYLYTLLWPANLGIDYGHTPQMVMSHWWGYATWTVPVILAVVLWRWRRSCRPAAAGAVVALLALAPVLGLTPHMFQFYSTTADHYLYLPMLGVALAAGWGLTRLTGRNAVAISVLVLLALTTRTLVQETVWSGNVPFWEHQLAVNPRCYLAMNGLAEDALRHGDPARARRLLEQSVAINPGYADTRQLLVRTLVQFRDLDGAIEQLQRYLQIVERFPAQAQVDLSRTRAQLGQILAARGRWKEAAAQFEKALQASPDNAEWQAALRRVRQAATRPATLPAGAAGGG